MNNILDFNAARTATQLKNRTSSPSMGNVAEWRRAVQHACELLTLTAEYLGFQYEDGIPGQKQEVITVDLPMSIDTALCIMHEEEPDSHSVDFETLFRQVLAGLHRYSQGALLI